MKPIAYEGSENYIFISYAHKDSEAVYPVLNMLQQNNYRFWYDDGIAPGSEWPENIAQHLNGSALVIAFVSPNSMASPNCRREINYALSKDKPFLSVFLEPTEMPPGMEMQLSAQQSIFRYNYSSLEGFCRKLLMTPDLDSARIPEASAAPADVPPQQPPKADSTVPFVSQAAVPVSASSVSPKKKSSLPLILAGVGAALAVLAAVLIIVLTGSKKSKDAGSGELALTEESLIGTYYFVDFTDDTYRAFAQKNGYDSGIDLQTVRSDMQSAMLLESGASSLRSLYILSLNEGNSMVLTSNSDLIGINSVAGTWKVENDGITCVIEDSTFNVKVSGKQIIFNFPLGDDGLMGFIFEK